VREQRLIGSASLRLREFVRYASQPQAAREAVERLPAPHLTQASLFHLSGAHFQERGHPRSAHPLRHFHQGCSRASAWEWRRHFQSGRGLITGDCGVFVKEVAESVPNFFAGAAWDN